MTKSGFDLADLRRLAVRKQMRVRFPVGNGMDCTISEHGIAKVPLLDEVPSFNLEHNLKSAERFELIPVNPTERPQSLSRDQLESLLASAASATPASDHED